MDTWVIIVIICGGIAVILLVLGLVFYCCKHKRQQSTKVEVVNPNMDARQESEIELKDADDNNTMGRPGNNSSSLPVLETDEEHASQSKTDTIRPAKPDRSNDITQ